MALHSDGLTELWPYVVMALCSYGISSDHAGKPDQSLLLICHNQYVVWEYCTIISYYYHYYYYYYYYYYFYYYYYYWTSGEF